MKEINIIFGGVPNEELTKEELSTFIELKNEAIIRRILLF